MSTTIPTPQDKRLLLQDTVTKTASFNSTALDLAAAPGGPGQRMTALVAIVSADDSNGDETYTYVLQESSDNVTFTAAGPAATVAGLGVLSVRGVVQARYVRLALTIGGTTPSITYKAWLNPLP